MKILHVSNFSQKHNGRLFYNIAPKLTNGFTRNGHNVLNFSDRDIARSSTIYGGGVLGKKKCNERFIETCKNYHPDIICLGHADIISPLSLEEVKNFLKDTKVIQWNVDHLAEGTPDNKDNIKRILSKVNVVDATFVTCSAGKNLEKIKGKYSKAYFIPNPTDRSIESKEIFLLDNFEFDLFFAISHGVGRGRLKFGKKDERENEILFLMERLPNIKFNLFGMFGKQPVWGSAFMDELEKCSMGLNLTRGVPTYLCSSDRLPAYAGNGLLTFIDRGTSFNQLYTEKELVFYDNRDELSDKIKFYKNNRKESRDIAERGWSRSHRSYNETIITKYIIERTMGMNFSSDYEWPTEPNLDEN